MGNYNTQRSRIKDFNDQTQGNILPGTLAEIGLSLLDVTSCTEEDEDKILPLPTVVEVTNPLLKIFMPASVTFVTDNAISASTFL